MVSHISPVDGSGRLHIEDEEEEPSVRSDLVVCRTLFAVAMLRTLVGRLFTSTRKNTFSKLLEVVCQCNM